MDNCVSISGDLHLAKTLDALKAKEDGQRELMAENRDLKEELYQERNAAQLLLDENTQLKSAQQQLCGEVDKLKHSNEDLKRENVQLKEKLTLSQVAKSQLSGRGGGDVEGSAGKGMRSGCPRCVNMDRELAKLKSANDELRYVNDQWDKDYREHEEAFRRYREDTVRAQSENESFIASLKESKEDLLEQIRDIQYELERSRKEVERLQQQHSVGHQNGISPQKLKALEEENTFLRTQLKAYQEDFEAERRDRERLSEEKQSAALRFEAEITSLKLQLDRCRNELVHYTTESTRLAQQLRLKNQYEEEQFKKHLESQGYIPRSPNSALPPLDPYVEIDPPPQPRSRGGVAPPTNTTTTTNPNNLALSRRGLTNGQLLARSAEDISRSAPTTSLHPNPSPPVVQRKSHPPSPTYVNQSQIPTSSAANGGYIMQNGHVVNSRPGNQYETTTPRQYQATPTSGQTLVNGSGGASVPYANGYGFAAPNGAQLVTGDGARVARYPYPPNFQQLVVGGTGSSQGQVVPRVESKGKYACPRCARRFNSRADCNDHKARCMS